MGYYIRVSVVEIVVNSAVFQVSIQGIVIMVLGRYGLFET